uniref:FHA domain-containing protein n=1 Tax=Pyramimonas obovata TaxID=1411642 RepID=A0A7S0WXU6_9CHLO|mmetsp:Transcript_9176/g.18976  ORF Transcript_9176/g.18976 Transcript_9176/m.18976 type:complete len:382 (+) Transcript_9176:135-1280(+)
MDIVGSLSAWAGETQREDEWSDDSCGATQQEEPLDEKSDVLYYLQGFGGGLDALDHNVKEKLVRGEVFEDETEFQVGRAISSNIAFCGKEFDVKANPYDQNTIRTRISTRHFRIECSSETDAGADKPTCSRRGEERFCYRLVDNSSFGTWVNGQKVDGFRMLCDGDEIALLMNRREPSKVDLGFRFLLSQPSHKEHQSPSGGQDKLPGLGGRDSGKDEMISKLERELQAVKSEVQSMKENPPKKKQKLTEAWRQVAKTPLGFSFATKPAEQPPGAAGGGERGERLLAREVQRTVSAALEPLKLEQEKHAACLDKTVKKIMAGIHAKAPVLNNRQLPQWEASDVALYLQEERERMEAYTFTYIGHMKSRECHGTKAHSKSHV